MVMQAVLITLLKAPPHCVPMHGAQMLKAGELLTHVVALARANTALMCPTGNLFRPWLPEFPPLLLSTALAQAQGTGSHTHTGVDDKKWHVISITETSL